MRKPCPDDSRIKHKRYTLVELLEGVTHENAQALITETAWFLQEEAVGEEIA